MEMLLGHPVGNGGEREVAPIGMGLGLMCVHADLQTERIPSSGDMTDHHCWNTATCRHDFSKF